MASARIGSRYRRAGLVAGTALATWAVAADAQAAMPQWVEDAPSIFVRNDLNPNTPPPGGVLDLGISGVGQMSVRGNPATTGRGVCTGTLVNPRTVMFAAHCVNTRPQEAYGPNGVPFDLWAGIGGTPISFGFQADNLPAIRLWLGLASTPGGTDADPALLHRTNEARALYNVEQVWYDPRSLLPASNRFLIADVAIATLDTPAFDIPQWKMLFSPLQSPENVLLTGYGNSGNENATAGVLDSRRRTVQNIVSYLGSLDTRNRFLFGSPSPLTNNIYATSFTDPNPNYNPAQGRFDFGIFGPSDVARPREGTVGGGDSGGPLVLENKYPGERVFIGVLSGSSRFFGAAQFWNYGGHTIYQPLHLYWDEIVKNTNYLYVSAAAGNGRWEDESRWTRDMDPAWVVDDGRGNLVNRLPDTPALGISPAGRTFGDLCFLDDCITLDTPAPVGSGTPVSVAGGPGTVGFDVNNRAANPRMGVSARYYDVLLDKAGTTSLSSSREIDRLSIEGAARLHVESSGRLSVLGEINQVGGTLRVDGRLTSGRDLFLLGGLLQGSGRIDAPFIVVPTGLVAPSGPRAVAQLYLNGNVILGAGSGVAINLLNWGSDRLTVSGALGLDGGALLLTKPAGTPVRDGNRYTIITADDGIDGRFGSVLSFHGVLQPNLAYNPTSIVVTMRAGSLARFLGQQASPTALAFATALDGLRATSYAPLSGLYGSIDTMAPVELGRTLAGLAPAVTGQTVALNERQSRVMLSAVTDRLSMLGSHAGGQWSVVGAPRLAAAVASGSGRVDADTARLGLAQGLVPGRGMGGLPEHMTGFVSGGLVADRAVGATGRQTAHFGMGVEMMVAPGLTLGSAVGHAAGASDPSRHAREADRTQARMTQAAIYGAWRPGLELAGGETYVAAVAMAETSRAEMGRRASTGERLFDLVGDSEARRLQLVGEAGVNLALGTGMTLTPRAQLSWSSYHLAGYRESGGELAFEIDGLTLERAEARLGVQAHGRLTPARGWSLAPRLQADVVSAVAGSEAGLGLRFAAAPGETIRLPFAAGDRQWSEVKGGVHLSRGLMSLGAGVETSIGRADWNDTRAVAEFGLRF